MRWGSMQIATNEYGKEKAMRVARLWTGFVSTLILAGAASAAVQPEPIEALAAKAQRIVVGDVVKISSFWDDAQELIKSRIVVHVDQYLVGRGTGTEILEMSGGTVDGVTLRVSVLPVFEVGDHVLLLLNDNPVRLVGAFQGAYLTDGEQVARMAPACGRIIEGSVQPLSDLGGAIEQALPADSPPLDVAPYDGDFQLPLGGLRYGLCGYSWAYQSNPMGESYRINANCADSSAGDANSQRTQIQLAADAWNNAGADFAFTYGGTSTQTSVTYNSTNLIYFDTTPPDGGPYVAATYIWTNTGGTNILECDLVFNDRDYTWWDGSTGTCGGNKMDIRNVATHELGHFLCLDDLYGLGDSQKTMYGYVGNCETNKRTLEQDDINGIIAIYGAGPACTDPVANAGPNKTFCPGNTVVLDGSASGGSGGLCPGNYSPSWAGPGIVSGGNTFNPTVNAAGTYTLTVSCDTCQDSDSVVVSEGTLGDWDADGNVDLADYAEFEACLDGPEGGLAAPGCACGDFDDDGDVDLVDFDAFQDSFTG
jgi:hypothetical protein